MFHVFAFRDYDHYVKEQIRANALKLERSSVSPIVIRFLADYVRRVVPKPTFGLCHGTRRGIEQQSFRDLIPGCEVVGTEIAPTATRFPHTVQWDFHQMNTDWAGRAAFIYSNSLDHAWNPQLAVTTWMQCLRRDGVCLIEHLLPRSETPVASDPFVVDIHSLLEAINRWGNGDFSVADHLNLRQAGIYTKRRVLVVRWHD